MSGDAPIVWRSGTGKVIYVGDVVRVTGAGRFVVLAIEGDTIECRGGRAGRSSVRFFRADRVTRDRRASSERGNSG